LKCMQSFEYYSGSLGGAYVLKLNAPVEKLQLSGLERFIVSGPLRQTAFLLSKLVQQRLSINNLEGAEGSRLQMQMRIDVRSLSWAEIITRFATNFAPNDVQFYTDSIGLQLIKRNEFETDWRPEMNYYPMPTALVLDDGSKRLSVLSNFSPDRRLKYDDGKGLGSDIPVDNLPVNMAFTFVLEEIVPEESEKLRKEICLQRQFAYNTLAAHQALRSLIYQPQVFIADGILEELPTQKVPSFPCDVQLLSVRPLAHVDSVRLMVVHRAGIDCRSLNAPTCIATEFDNAIKKYLRSIGASKIQKTLLNGVQKIGKEIDYYQEKFSLKPMDFAAYLVRFS
uniref:Glyco_hydro_38C domain-containing protein n=1 Tax=Gongylonema pulchrum TaxID=637853 RepID=A0A183CVL2_9BILA